MTPVGGEGLILAQIGDSLSEKTAINYLFESLWDFRSSENNGLPGEYFLSIEGGVFHFNFFFEFFSNFRRRFLEESNFCTNFDP